MISPLLHTWNLNLGYAKRLVADVPDDLMAFQPAAHMNHAAWVLGHLACTADMLGAIIGARPVCPPAWVGMFDWNSDPSSDASRYPTKAVLLTALEDGHARIAAALPGSSILTISECRFESSNGGGVFAYIQEGDQLLIERSSFLRTNGVGVALVNTGGQIGLRSLLIAKASGDAILANQVEPGGTFSLSNLTVAENLGTGLRVDALLVGELQLSNSIISGNAGAQIGTPVIPGASITVSNSLIRGSAFTQALRGVAIGLPLPVCSCGVVPIYRELIRQGTSLAAALNTRPLASSDSFTSTKASCSTSPNEPDPLEVSRRTAWR
jgi:hypothetical protein